MMRPLMAGAMLLALVACGKEEAKAPETGTDGTAQIASLEDYALPVDKSDQVTAIDAATGDASGMPRDGGAVIAVAKPDPRPAVVAPVAENATAAVPVIAAPPPPVAAPAPAPALTVPIGN